MTTSTTEFFEALNEQEKKFLPALAADNLGLLLRAAINELDWYSYNLAREANPTMEQQEQFYLLNVGVPRLVKLALDARPSFDVPTVSFRRDPSRTIPVLELAAGLGMIQHGRRVAQMAMSGVGTVERVAEREFMVTLPAFIPDDDFYERSVAEHYHSASRANFATIMSSDLGRELTSEVDQLLTELVYPFAGHFIGYDAHPTLDAYFFGIASHEIQLAEGYDSFHYSIKFGGVSFQKYTLAVAFLISIAFRHERFAQALVTKVPEIRLENVLTISSETEPFIQSLREAINFFGSVFEDFEEATLDEARVIFTVLSVGRESSAILDRPGCALPPLIRNSDHDFIRCQTAANTLPMQFLLDSLRYHFPREYDEHQRTREGAMQAAIQRVLSDACPNLKYLDNVKIRSGGQVLTDIDLVALEPVTGAVLLFQLKHQDLYGFDIHSRHVRTTRLKQQAERWLAATKAWLESVGEAGLRKTLRLPKGFPNLTVYRLVVARHYGFPIAQIDRDEDVAFANWNQFFNAVQLAKQTAAKPVLAHVIRHLRDGEQPGGRQEHLPEPRSEWIIDELKFTTQQG